MEKLSIIVPAYNEAALLENSVERLLKIENQIIQRYTLAKSSNIIIVDDGSKDHTWSLIQKMHKKNNNVKGIHFSRNFGHQAALIAGLKEAILTATITITIDADLQDDPDKMIEMVDFCLHGADIVYGVRNNRQADTWFKRTSAQGYYAMLNHLGVQLVPNHADFRLMTQQAVTALLTYPERNFFLRGLIPKLGFQTAKVYYKRTPRMAGESKYPLKKMLAFAWDGVTSLTIVPVRLILALGIFASLVAILMLIYSMLAHSMHLTIHGWSSLMVSVWFLGGLQMISLGIIGEYIGKVTTEVKQRPRYIIQSKLE
jgi:glycosyltransferase involved in cell wall biosynthesis